MVFSSHRQHDAQGQIPDGPPPVSLKRVTALSMGINILLSAMKLVVGLLGGSRTLVADAVHSLSDLATDAAVWIGLRYWTRPPDDGHPYGHRRIETLVTMGLALSLAAVALGIGWDALVMLRASHVPHRLSALPLIVALISIGVKEGLYRWTVSVGRRWESAAVVANAWHHRSDALSSIPAGLAVGVAWWRPEWGVIDHVGAVVMAMFILGVSWQLGWPALRELTDAGVARRDIEWIRRTVMGTPGVRDVHAVRTRYIGPRVQVDLHILVDGGLTVREGHDISEQVKRRLLRDGPSIGDVVVHFEPEGS